MSEFALDSMAARRTRGKPGACRSARGASHIRAFIEHHRLRRSAIQCLVLKRLAPDRSAKSFLSRSQYEVAAFMQPTSDFGAAGSSRPPKFCLRVLWFQGSGTHAY